MDTKVSLMKLQDIGPLMGASSFSSSDPRSKRSPFNRYNQKPDSIIKSPGSYVLNY